MIHFRIISVGKAKEAWIETGFSHYNNLLSKYAALEDVVVKAEKVRDESQRDLVLAREEENICARLESDNFLIVMDAAGKQYTSEKLAEYFNSKFNQGRSRFDLVIGSALGLSYKLKERADLLLSLSKLTFPHELTRLILAEQLYRALSILRGSKYHK